MTDALTVGAGVPAPGRPASILRYCDPAVVFQEVPGEISLAVTVTGCPLRCDGCHTAYAQDPQHGEALTLEAYERLLQRYAGLISCALFFGGEWAPEALCPLLDRARQRGLKTALYSGHLRVAPELYKRLDFLKTGPYVAKRGGLTSPTTNQRFIATSTGHDLTHLFHKPLRARD